VAEEVRAGLTRSDDLSDQPLALEVVSRAPLSDARESDAIRIAQWDRDLWLLEQEAAEPVVPLRIPAALTASQVLELARDPDLFRRRLRRPMPPPPAPAARWGVQFHTWVEALLATRAGTQLALLEPDDLPGAADEDIRTPEDLVQMRERFLTLPYAGLEPVAVEAPFVVRIGERTIRGRIDAVFRINGVDEVIDWKTGRGGDPLQLAIYRLAWAERQGVPVDQVQAAFVMVRTGDIVRPRDLPGRVELEALLNAAEPDAAQADAAESDVAERSTNTSA
jgi:DNA helicase-2/ATP-dependent DNA helicase PcrA